MTNAREYTVELTNFAGPLDLLLNLIEKRELEITEVAVGQVTGDYLRTISAIERIDERELMWFLDIATRLLGHKSRALRALSQGAQTDDDESEDTTSLADLAEQLRQLLQERGLTSFKVLDTGTGDIAQELNRADQGTKLWKWFVIAALLFLAFEILIIRLTK